jgi:SHS2 domain-containing protein
VKKYTILDHTADIRLFIEAETLQELFSAALDGMAQIIAPETCKQELTCKHTLSLKAPDSTVLLIDFLSTALTYTHTDKAVFCTINFNGLTEKTLDAQIFGTKVQEFKEDIKAVTYHEAEIIEKNKKLSTIIVFDI